MNLLVRSLSTAALTATFPVFAQPEEPLIELPTFTVTPHHFEQLSTEVPANIDYLSAADLALKPYTSLPEALDDLPGLSFTSFSGNPTSAGIRLRSFSETGTRRILVLLDGLRLNPPDLANINWSLVPLSSIESVEVLRGSHAVAYGSQAIGGVIKLHTRIPTGTHSELSTVLGSDGLVNVRGSGSYGEPSWGVLGGLEHLSSAGFRDYSSFETDAAHLSGQFALGSASLRLQLQAAESDETRPGPLRSEADRFPVQRRAGAPGQEESEESLRLSGLFETSREEAFQFQLASGASHRERDILNYVFSGFERFSHYRYDDVFANPRVRFANESFDVTAGLDVTYQELDLEIFGPTGAVSERESYGNLLDTAQLREGQAAAYTLVTVRLPADLSLSGGFRLAKYDISAEANPVNNPFSSAFDADQDDEAWAGNIGLNWAPTGSQHYWVRLDRFYRFPLLDEIASYQGFLFDPPLNTSLKPETGLGLELGAAWAVTANLNLEANAFGQRFRDEIEFDAGSGASSGFPTGLNVNRAKTEAYGIETVAAYTWEPFWFRLAYTWQQAQYIEGFDSLVDYSTFPPTVTHRPLEGKDRYLVPRHQLQLDVEVEPLERFFVATRLRYASDQWEGNDVLNQYPKLPEYWLVGLDFRYVFVKHVTVFLSIDNLFDRHYALTKYSRDNLFDSGFSDWYPEPGRSFRVGLTAAF